MGFEKFNLRTAALVAVAGLVLFGVLIAKMFVHEQMPEQVPEAVVDSNQALPVEPVNNDRQMNEITQEDVQSMKEMKEQMESDRLQQKKIKMLKLQLEQTNLQLEQEKAMSEISKLEKDNASIVNDSNDQGQDKYPDVKVIYIGGTADVKEAILSINGNNYSIKEKNKPIKNMEVVAISDTAVTVHFNLPQDLTTTIEYKPE